MITIEWVPIQYKNLCNEPAWLRVMVEESIGRNLLSARPHDRTATRYADSEEYTMVKDLKTPNIRVTYTQWLHSWCLKRKFLPAIKPIIDYNNLFGENPTLNRHIEAITIMNKYFDKQFLHLPHPPPFSLPNTMPMRIKVPLFYPALNYGLFQS